LTSSIQAQVQANLYTLRLANNQQGQTALKLLESIKPLVAGSSEPGKGGAIDVVG